MSSDGNKVLAVRWSVKYCFVWNSQIFLKSCGEEEAEEIKQEVGDNLRRLCSKKSYKSFN